MVVIELEFLRSSHPLLLYYLYNRYQNGLTLAKTKATDVVFLKRSKVLKKNGNKHHQTVATIQGPNQKPFHKIHLKFFFYCNIFVDNILFAYKI